MKSTLRPAQAEDAPFLESVYASTRAAELAAVPWSAEQKAAFCRMQFEAQCAHYAQHYAAATQSIIERDGMAAGRLYVNRGAEEIRIVDIALLPQHRGGGLGTQHLLALQKEARGAGKALTIHVEKFNPALRLYERLGFQPIEDKGIHLLMEWRAA